MCCSVLHCVCWCFWMGGWLRRCPVQELSLPFPSTWTLPPKHANNHRHVHLLDSTGFCTSSLSLEWNTLILKGKVDKWNGQMMGSEAEEMSDSEAVGHSEMSEESAVEIFFKQSPVRCYSSPAFWQTERGRGVNQSGDTMWLELLVFPPH